MRRQEIRTHLEQKILPFWEGLRDKEHGGYYGYMDFELKTDRQAVKGCILNSRILWFFSNAFLTLGEKRYLDDARHAYEFLKTACLDREEGGVFWSVMYDGRPADTMKHTYNQAFAIYALASYYDASRDTEALELAQSLFNLIEERCKDSQGYLEAFSRDFVPAGNEKLSENGVLAAKTMNTLLHVFEAYTELYRVSPCEKVEKQLRWILGIFAEKVYNPQKKRQEVFFDKDWNSLIDLHSYGHDIETAWLIDRGCEVIGDDALTREMGEITRALTAAVYEKAYRNHSLLNEAENGVDDTTRVWWVQAESVVGFWNGFEKTPECLQYRQAACDIWDYILTYLVDPRQGSEWFWDVTQEGEPQSRKPIVEAWKCPYHNGRMCFEMLRRMEDAS